MNVQTVMCFYQQQQKAPVYHFFPPIKEYVSGPESSPHAYNQIHPKFEFRVYRELIPDIGQVWLDLNKSSNYK